jgi:hypothetical protein
MSFPLKRTPIGDKTRGPSLRGLLFSTQANEAERAAWPGLGTDTPPD